MAIAVLSDSILFFKPLDILATIMLNCSPIDPRRSVCAILRILLSDFKVA